VQVAWRPRPVVIACVQTLMVLGLLSFAFAVPGSLYIGSLVVGFTYGGLCSLMPVTAGELFGLKSLGCSTTPSPRLRLRAPFVLSESWWAGSTSTKQTSPHRTNNTCTCAPAPRTAPLGVGTECSRTKATELQHPATLPQHVLNSVGAPSHKCSGPHCLGASGLLQGAGKKCFGPQCFFLIFVILAVTASLGSTLPPALAWRSRRWDAEHGR